MKDLAKLIGLILVFLALGAVLVCAAGPLEARTSHYAQIADDGLQRYTGAPGARVYEWPPSSDWLWSRVQPRQEAACNPDCACVPVAHARRDCCP